MKTPLFLLAVVLTSCLAVSSQASDTSKIPDLKGTWVGEYSAQHHDGVGLSVQTVTVLDQSAAGFRGTREWTRKSFIPAQGAKAPALKTKKYLFAGVVGFDNKTLYFADQGQGGYMIGELVSPDKMKIIFMRSGDRAIAFRAVLKRVKS